MTGDELTDIEVVYALPDEQRVIQLRLPAGSEARQAVLQSGLDMQFPQLDLTSCPIGVFGRQVEDDYRLNAGDRVEIYRVLPKDPLELRRARANEKS